MPETYKAGNINGSVEISGKFDGIHEGVDPLNFSKQDTKIISGDVAEQIGNGLENNILNVKNYNKNIEPLAQCPTGQKLIGSAIKATDAMKNLHMSEGISVFNSKN